MTATDLLLRAMSRTRWLLARDRIAEADSAIWQAMRPHWLAKGVRRGRRIGPRMDALLALLPTDPGTVATRLGISRAAASQLLSRAARSGLAKRTARGRYASAPGGP